MGQAYADEAHPFYIEREMTDITVDWQFRYAADRITLEQMYPSISE